MVDRPLAVLVLMLTACSSGGGSTASDAGVDAAPPVAQIDRFSASAGTLMVREDTNGLPAPGEPVDFDVAPFIGNGLGPNGEHVSYYNFDIKSRIPSPIYVFVRPDGTPVEGQDPVVDVLPGDEGYNDFWQVVEVTLPDERAPNFVTSRLGIDTLGLETRTTDRLLNGPLVPEGSTATRRVGDGDPEPRRVWYRSRIAHQLVFAESELRLSETGFIPIAYIFVTFNVNPDEPGGGPPSGFVHEPGSDQSHNVVETLPGEDDYSPLWRVMIYDNAEFDAVSDEASAKSATQFPIPQTLVNCPIVHIE